MSATTLTARELFRTAYENRYTWDKNFPGYTADVTFKDNDRTFTGQVRVNEDMSTEVFNIEDEQALAQVKSQLWETSIHRVRRSFEDVHGQNTFRYGNTDETGAVEILMGGKSEGDRYKLRDKEVCHVHRHIVRLVPCEMAA